MQCSRRRRLTQSQRTFFLTFCRPTELTRRRVCRLLQQIQVQQILATTDLADEWTAIPTLGFSPPTFIGTVTTGSTRIGRPMLLCTLGLPWMERVRLITLPSAPRKRSVPPQ